ncbi:MAG: hypothetical protein HDS11_01345 [Bacteroides sp.]|nr:hypothetical protein [Bacteroides sp.]
MRKFTLLAAAALTAFAAQAVDRTQTLVQPNLNALNLNRTSRVVSMPESDMLSRADEATDISGTYQLGLYYVIAANGGQSLAAEFIEGGGSFDIVADPEVENGYIVKRFLEDFWGDASTEFNDLKATWEPATQTLTIAPNQLLFTYVEEDGQVDNTYLVCSCNGGFDATQGVKLQRDFGRFIMADGIDGFVLGEPVAGNPTQVLCFPFWFLDLNVFIPNGTMTGTVELSDSEQEMEWPIYGVWNNGGLYVFNFGLLDPLDACGLYYDKANGKAIFSSDGRAESPIAAYYLQYYPEAGYNLNTAVYACEIDEDYELIGSNFSLSGTVTEATNDKVSIKFPDYAMVTNQDAFVAVFKDVELNFNPGAVAGIETIETSTSAAAPEVYYNLQGMRVMNPSNGIFIRQQGKDAVKVLVK